jgi:multiple sugar transport system permease protein
MVDNRMHARPGHVRRRWPWLRAAGFYAMVVGVLLPIMFPYYVMLTASLKTQVQNMSFPPQLLFTPTLRNYVSVLTKNNMQKVLTNSLIVGLASTGIGLALALPSAFAIARLRIDVLGVVVLVARMLPGIAMLVPWYLMFSQAKLVGTYWALVFSHLSVSIPLIIWVSVGFFEDLPEEIMDAAAIDGCSLFGAFWRVALPLVRPGIAASAVLAFIQSWNNFLYSLVLGGRIQMAPVVAYSMVAEYDPNWGGMNAAAVLITWPVILLSLPLGKNLVKGLTAGALKG